MKLNSLIVALCCVLFNNVCFGQQWINLPQNDDARLYMANFREQNVTEKWLRCTGVFIRDNHVLTAASCVHNRPRESLRLFSGVTGTILTQSGTQHLALEVHIHPDFNAQFPLRNNLAVVRVDNAITRPEPLRPRPLGRMSANRFCTMLGWQGYQLGMVNEWNPLRMFSVPIVNSTQCGSNHQGAYCTSNVGLTSGFSTCGGLMGAPVFCGNDQVSGIVVRDNFCDRPGTNVGGSFVSVEDFRGWIDEVSSGINNKFSVTLLMTALFVLFKISS